MQLTQFPLLQTETFFRGDSIEAVLFKEIIETLRKTKIWLKIRFRSWLVAYSCCRFSSGCLTHTFCCLNNTYKELTFGLKWRSPGSSRRARLVQAMMT